MSSLKPPRHISTLPTPAKNEAAPISLFVRWSSREFLLSSSLLDQFQNSPHTLVVETDHEQVEIARRATPPRSVASRGRTPTDPAMETNRGSRSGAVVPIVRRRLKTRRSGLTDRSQPGLRHDVYRFVVNGSAPELFLVMSLVRIWCTRCETEERRAFDWAGVTCYKALKVLDILFLTNCPLNRI
jgi:hypothetical protein